MLEIIMYILWGIVIFGVLIAVGHGMSVRIRSTFKWQSSADENTQSDDGDSEVRQIVKESVLVVSKRIDDLKYFAGYVIIVKFNGHYCEFDVTQNEYEKIRSGDKVTANFWEVENGEKLEAAHLDL